MHAGEDIESVRHQWAAALLECPLLAASFADVEVLARAARGAVGGSPAARDAFLRVLLLHYARYDAAHTAVEQEAEKNAESEEAAELLSRALQLATGARAHRSLALWLLRESTKAKQEAAAGVACLERLRFWEGEGLERLLLRSAIRLRSVLGGSEKARADGEERVVARWRVEGRSRWVAMAELLSSAMVHSGASGWGWHEKVWCGVGWELRSGAEEEAGAAARGAESGAVFRWQGKSHPLSLEKALLLAAGKKSVLSSVAGSPALVPRAGSSSRRLVLECVGGMRIVWESSVLFFCWSGGAGGASGGSRMMSLESGGSGYVLGHDMVTLVSVGSPADARPLLSAIRSAPAFVPLEEGECALACALLSGRGATRPTWAGEKKNDELAVLLDWHRGVHLRVGQRFGRTGELESRVEPGAAEEKTEEERDAAAGVAQLEVSRAEKDPSLYWVNERTLLSWLPASIFLSISAVSLLRTSTRGAQISGVCMASLALLVSLYALSRFLLRNSALRSGRPVHAPGVVDWWGPWVLVPLVCVVQVLIVVFAVPPS